MAVNGSVTRLRAGHYEATVAAVGATLLSLTHRGRHLVEPVDPGELGRGYEGRSLVPWPNRVSGGRYTVGEKTYLLPVNEAQTGAALHGLGLFQHWQPTALGPDRGTWVLDLPATYGYPFDVLCRTTYVVHEEDGLTITVSGTNQGSEPAPFGASSHPYLTCELRPLAECTLQLPGRSALMTDGAMAPTQLDDVTGTDHDFLEPTLVGGRLVDNAYTDLPEGAWAVRLTHPEAVGVQMTSDARWVQLFTGERPRRLGAAVEPMTCPPDAFNGDLEGVLLAPGASCGVTMTISALA